MIRSVLNAIDFICHRQRWYELNEHEADLLYTALAEFYWALKENKRRKFSTSVLRNYAPSSRDVDDVNGLLTKLGRKTATLGYRNDSA